MNEKIVINCDADPFVPDGWKVEEHRKGGMFEWNPDNVRLYFSNKQKNGSCIGGHDLRKELADQPVLNANVLDYLLAEHLIPDEWKGKYIFFWGTIYRDSDGNLYVRYLYCCGFRWSWEYCRLSNNWSDGYPAAVRIS